MKAPSIGGWRSRLFILSTHECTVFAHVINFRRLYTSILSNKEWLDDLHAADAIFVATHSQGSIVSTHLLDRLIHDQHIRTSRNTEAIGSVDPFSTAGVAVAPIRKPQKICCLALCGIHLGPLRYLSSSSLLQPYIQVCLYATMQFMMVEVISFHPVL